jgi:hypothetical protein
MSGIGTTTAAEVFSERVELQPRTSDPSSTEEGEGWIRSDIAPESNQIATFRVDTGGSTIDVPILQTGTATDGVVEALRLSVGGTLGYVPAIPESKAAFPALRLQHNGQVYGWHDARGETAFFDVAITATNSPVDDGETLTVDYSVENTGGSLNDTQDIRLDVGATERDRESGVTIASGGLTGGQLSWASASEGSYTATVLSDDDSASTSVSVGPAIPDSGLLRRYQFNDDSDTTTAIDSEGSNDGTINGATYTTNAAEGSHALDFDGTDDYVSIPSFSQFGSYTIVSWLYKDTFNAIENAWYFQENNAISFRTRDTTSGSRAISNGIELVHNDGSTSFYVESEFNIGRWQMFAGTWDGSTLKLYRDESGSITEKDSVSAPVMGSKARGTVIGRNGDTASRNWTGRQDDYPIYNRALSQSELQQIYDSVA